MRCFVYCVSTVSCAWIRSDSVRPFVEIVVRVLVCVCVCVGVLGWCDFGKFRGRPNTVRTVPPPLKSILQRSRPRKIWENG